MARSSYRPYTARGHLVDNLKAKTLIGMDIIGPEGMFINANARMLTIKSCDLTAPLRITPKGQRVDIVVRALSRIVVLPHTVSSVPTKMRGKQSIPSNRDYSVHSKQTCQLNLGAGGFFAHLADAT